jgi:hypothetical protein
MILYGVAMCENYRNYIQKLSSWKKRACTALSMEIFQTVVSMNIEPTVEEFSFFTEDIKY